MKISLFRNLLFLGAFLFSGFSIAQEVAGTVSDANGPLPGANVIVQGTNNGTTTDFDGKYTLTGIDPNAILIFSYLGFITQEIPVNGRSTINVTLNEDSTELSEVVITGYSQQETRDITGSVSVVKAEDLVATTPTNVESALQGQSPGVTVGLQGGPGQTAVVRIRGYGTINGNDPLYIIDGTPTGAGLAAINPNDIETIQILKDASSAAIYGNRAANGVIIITTKSGKRNNKVQFSADAYVGVDFIPNSVFPEFATPQQIAQSIWDAAENDGTGIPDHPQFGNGSSPVIPVYIFPQGASTADESLYDYENNRITRANPNGTDWFDEYFNPAITQQYNVSASGGSEHSNFYMSLSALNQDGTGLYTGFERYTLRANSAFDVTEKFRLGENITVSYSDQIIPPGVDVNNGTISSLYRMHPLIPVKDVGGNYAGVGVGGLGNANNALAIAYRNKDNSIINIRALGNVFAEYDVFEDLTFKTTLGFDLNAENVSDFTPRQLEGEAPVTAITLAETNRMTTSYTWFNTLNYSKDFGDHSLGLLAGTEFNKFKFKQSLAAGDDFLFDNLLNLRYLNISPGSLPSSGAANINTYFSAFGKVDYKFKDTYLLSATFRHDSSSLFGPGNRDGFFPSFSAGWRVSNEPFMENQEVISNLMLKVGYGIVGNNGSINPWDRADVYTANPDYFSYPTSNTASAIGYGLQSRGNPDLTWETTSTLNMGFTSRWFNKVTFDFEWYTSTTEDMLINVPYDPTVYGNTNIIRENIGEMNNKGFDAALSYNDITSGDFSYNIGINVSAYKNEVVTIDPGNEGRFIQGDRVRDQLPNRTQAGQPLASFYGKKFTGIGPDGRMQFANDGEQQFIGNPHPDFTYGLTFSGDYKGFDFSLLIQGSQGNDIYNFMKFFTDFNTFVGAKSVNYVNENGLPALTNDAGIIADESAQSSYYVEDGSYARLKNIVIGYSLPEGISSKLGVEKIRFYLQGKNLLTLTDYSGLDPEINLRNVPVDNLSEANPNNPNLTIGLDSGVYPIDRSVILGLNVSF
ncbi:SusC/RagA family TonB-linked outer membrane protein [Abyssalbus ytuae]|uniref:TonB-dependent receptor n=1 Tax=Abyssalbus ytuae TaxID=2926907 RepID=A0A9E7A0Q5_9FLAO|nr:TonB-dependent receptor [Abyssalbus ytuae]UOB18802.1 TonB-dependent receptor [Abyssalbus ytuae]